MDIEKLQKIISSLGFPVVACCAMFWLIVDVISKNTTAIHALTEAVSKL